MLSLQLPESCTLAIKPLQYTRRVSLPLSTIPYKPNVSLLSRIESPDISVNSPRIDKVVEFPLASAENHPLFPIRRTSLTPAQCSSPLFPTRRTSSTSAQCSSASPSSGDRSITKDKCTVQVLGRTLAKPHITPSGHRAPRNGSDCSKQNPATVVSSRSSFDSRQRRFDTSSYQQRAEALEGLLEFSARLLQQERFDELGVLLKPFGPEKVSPRETAIWLTKSFKETPYS